MKILLTFLLLCFVYGMGDPNFIPMNPRMSREMAKTSKTLNQVEHQNETPKQSQEEIEYNKDPEQKMEPASEIKKLKGEL